MTLGKAASTESELGTQVDRKPELGRGPDGASMV